MTDTTMLNLGPAAGELKSLLTSVSDDSLSASTPCEHYCVGDLLDHLMGLTLAFTAAATKSTGTSDEGAPPPDLLRLRPPTSTPTGAAVCPCSSTPWWPLGRTRPPGQGSARRAG